MRHAAKIRIMKLRIWIKKHKLLSIALLFGALALTVPEVRLAFTIGSGIGLGQLQDRIETIQSRGYPAHFSLKNVGSYRPLSKVSGGHG